MGTEQALNLQGWFMNTFRVHAEGKAGLQRSWNVGRGAAKPFLAAPPSHLMCGFQPVSSAFKMYPKTFLDNPPQKNFTVKYRCQMFSLQAASAHRGDC